MLGNILSQLGINETLWIQLAVFLLVFILLRTLYFQPFLSIIERREREGKGKRKEAEALLKKAKEEQSRYEQEVSLARREARREQEEKLSLLKGKVSKEITALRKTNKERMAVAREEIEKEKALDILDLEKCSEKVSKKLVEKLIQAKLEL